MSTEARARKHIDDLLQKAGWSVCGLSQADIHGAAGVAIREFTLASGHGVADYLLYVNGKAEAIEMYYPDQWRKSPEQVKAMTSRGKMLSRRHLDAEFQRSNMSKKCPWFLTL